MTTWVLKRYCCYTMFSLADDTDSELKHTTTLCSLFAHDILNREWGVIVDQAQANDHGSPMVL